MTTDLPKVLLKTVRDFADISITHAASTLEYPPGVEANIQKEWDEYAADLKSQGKNVWDSVNYRLNSFSSEDGSINLELAQLNFSTRVVLKHLHADEVADLGEKGYVQGLMTGVLAKTTDGFYIFGKKSNKNVSRDEVETIFRAHADDELKDLLFVKEGNLESFTKKTEGVPSFVPVIPELFH